jgi:hypothetical protein
MPMRDETNELRRLAERVTGGAPGAAATFLSRIEPQVVRMVRRVMHTGATDTPFARLVAAEARALAPRGDGADPEELVGRIARRVCRAMVEKLGPDAARQFPGRETVLTGRDTCAVLV